MEEAATSKTYVTGPRNPSVTKTLLGGTLGNTRPQAGRKDAIFTKVNPAIKVPTANEPTFARQTHSPFPVDIWLDALCNHPDSDLVNDLLNDIEYGVRIGFHQDCTPLISPIHFSATSKPALVAKELERELLLNRKAGPFLSLPFSNFVVSPMGGCYSQKALPAAQKAYYLRSFVARRLFRQRHNS